MNAVIKKTLANGLAEVKKLVGHSGASSELVV